jgi:hypothetical protein
LLAGHKWCIRVFLFSLDPLEYGDKDCLVGAEGKYKREADTRRRVAFNAVLPLAGFDVFFGCHGDEAGSAYSQDVCGGEFTLRG